VPSHIAETLSRCRSLEIPRIDNCGDQLFGDEVKAIASQNRFLKEVILDGALSLLDRSIIEILKHCDSIVSIKITGSASRYGYVIGNFAGYFNQHRNKWMELRALHLDDQLLLKVS
jgi:hypothetical protein